MEVEDSQADGRCGVCELHREIVQIEVPNAMLQSQFERANQ